MADLLHQIAAVLVEHEGSIDLMTAAGYVDLYRYHTETAGEQRVEFELFVRDGDLIAAAAAVATRESGVETTALPPLP